MEVQLIPISKETYRLYEIRMFITQDTTTF